jgi:hypothetical protein
MPILVLASVVSIVLIVHAAKTGRFSPWGYLMLFLPGIGSFAYVLFELVPEWLGSYQGQQAQRHLTRKLNPEKRYRALIDELAVADTIANRAALAEECLYCDKHAKAEEHYLVILARPLGDDPSFMLGLARAQFGFNRPGAAVATLDDLRRRWPNFESADGHLLYAKALESDGRLAEAAEEYKVLAGYYAGAEPRARYGLLLRKMGRDAEAVHVLNELLAYMRRAPRHVRKQQAEWIAVAEKAARS